MQTITPWGEKYRPRKLKDIVHQSDIVKILKQNINSNNIPHMLFYGPPGVGKTTAILALSHELFGYRIFSDRIMELNASDDRGIDVVRNTIIQFAKISLSEKDPDYPCPNYKIIILDEADAMTSEAQSALRKIMEDYSNITRFCFICNYINQIIEPIQSRCMKLRFNALSSQFATKRILEIANNEKLELNEEIADKIVELANGDMRKCLIYLQNLKYVSDKPTMQNLYGISNYVPQDIVIDLFETATNKQTKIKPLMNKVYNLIADGYSVHNMLEQLLFVITKSKIDDIIKYDMSMLISQTEHNLLNGADEYLQLLNLLAQLKKKCI